MTFQKNRFFLFLFSFLTLILRSQTSSVSAITSDCPFTIGSIYLVYPALYNPLGLINITYDNSLSNNPSGVVVAPRALKLVDTIQPKIDYSLIVTYVSCTQFSVNVSLSAFHHVDYSLFIVDYFTSAIVTGLRVFSGPTYISHVMESQFQIFSWNVSAVDVKTSSTLTMAIPVFLSELVADYTNSNFTTISTNLYEPGTLSFTVKYKLHPDTIVTEIRITCIVYDIHFASSLNFTLDSSTFYLQDQFAKINFYTDAPYATHFMGFSTIQGNLIMNKIQFNFGYGTQNEPVGSNTLSYRQAHPQLYINASQQAAPYKTTYTGKRVLFSRKTCNADPDHQYLDISTQLCYSKCPLGYYSGTNNHCFNCFSCTSINNCTQCFSNGCASGKFFDVSTTPFKCKLCNLQLTYCTECLASVTGVACTLCYSTYFINTTAGNCNFCYTYIRNCMTCSTDHVVCQQCLPSTKTQPYLDSCIPCNSTSFYNQTSFRCNDCSLEIYYCNQCSFSGSVVCVGCEVGSQFVGGVCVPCNSSSYYDYGGEVCMLCPSSLSNCEECEQIIGIVQCTRCIIGVEVELVNGECLSCNDTSFYDHLDGRCYSCQYHLSNCKYCHYGSVLQCLQCNNEYLPPTCQYIPPNQNDEDNQQPTKCYLSSYDLITEKCIPIPALETAMVSLTTVASVPTLNLLSSSFTSLINLFDDLSYYTYHHRNYSTTIELIFEQMTEFTILRFLPFQLRAFYQSIDFSYKNKLLKQDVFNVIPREFEQNDHSIYFLVVTQNVTKTLLTLVPIFMVLMLFHWIINRKIKSNALKPFNYVGMIVVSLLSSNVQYLSFRCFSQLLQPIPINLTFYVNLIICFIVLFFVLLYSIGGIIIFSSFYNKVNSQYILQQLFNHFWIVWYVIQNLFKFSTGFIHAYFYYQSFLQIVFLTIIYFAKAMIFSLMIKRIQSRIEYIIQLLINCIFFILNCFFVFEAYFMEYEGKQLEHMDYLRDMEFFLVGALIVVEILGIVVINIRSVIIYVKRKLIMKLEKELIADIQITKYDNKKIQIKSQELSKKYLRSKRFIQDGLKQQTQNNKQVHNEVQNRNNDSYDNKKKNKYKRQHKKQRQTKNKQRRVKSDNRRVKFELDKQESICQIKDVFIGSLFNSESKILNINERNIKSRRYI